MRIATRLHTNGWLSIVEERADGDHLIGSALAPDGIRHHAPEVRRPENGLRLGYDARKTRAQQSADQVVMIAASHHHCRTCEPWRSSLA